mmetsp:Transcript_601/g.2389  ORF Transcript_601/g.2389 Transcript_601/m.2389 type:complete len:222 (-) Transcript_601:395-1060(-)
MKSEKKTCFFLYLYTRHHHLLLLDQAHLSLLIPEGGALVLARVDAKEHVVPAGEVGHIPGLAERRGDLFGRLDSPELDQADACLPRGLRDQPRRLGLTLCLDNGGLPLLVALQNDVLCPLGLLLCDLLLLDRLGELDSELEVGDRDVLDDQVEVPGPLGQVLLDLCGHFITLRQELLRVVLRHHGLEDLVGDRRQHPLVVVEAQVTEDGLQHVQVWPGENP